MGKRSRDVSFSPSADESSSPSTAAGQSAEDLVQLHPGKIKAVDIDDRLPLVQMQCSLPPHSHVLSFASIEEYEIHYAKEHTNRCTSCGRNFPTAHFLNLHIDENHNPLRQAAQEKGERTYACFVEDCERKCSTPQKRRLHLIDKHMFPRVYNFRIVDVGIDKSTSILSDGQKRRVSISKKPKESSSGPRRASIPPNHRPIAATGRATHEGKDFASRSFSSPEGTSASTPKADPGSAEFEELERSMSALRFVPASVLKRQGHNTLPNA